MKNVRGVVLTLFAVTLGSMAALAQYSNTATGYEALHSDTTGSQNTADGYEALVSNTNGGYVTATGAYALWSNTSGGYDTADGEEALYSNTTGFYNTATGYKALLSNTDGGYDTADGVLALASNTSGVSNTATGFQALYSNTTADYNTAIGGSALFYNTTGSYNTATGFYALSNNSTGGNNIAVGYEAGNNVTGSYNIDIGSEGSSSDNDTIRIGTPTYQTSFYAAGIDGVTVSSGVEVFINSSGQLGTVNSSLRFKEDVHDMGDASSAILRLRPVTYRYKHPYADGSKPIDYGLIAEEVAEVYPDLVVKGADGQIQTVQYQKLTPMLLNELQKQHQLVEQMGKTMARQQETIQLLRAQQTGTVQLLEKRLAALEAAQPAARLEARVAAQ
jgi:trimeric autotransporter adhesin